MNWCESFTQIPELKVALKYEHFRQESNKLILQFWQITSWTYYKLDAELLYKFDALN